MKEPNLGLATCHNNLQYLGVIESDEEDLNINDAVDVTIDEDEA